MNLMDLIKHLKMETYNDKKNTYYKCIHLGTMTTGKIEDKLELFKLLCFLTQQLTKKDPVKYGKPINVLNLLYENELKNNTDNHAFKNYIDSLGILCEDLLYCVNEIQNPGFTNSKDIILRIKQLIEQWIPF